VNCSLYYFERLHIFFNTLVNHLLLRSSKRLLRHGLALEDMVKADLGDVVHVEGEHRPVQVFEEHVLVC